METSTLPKAEMISHVVEMIDDKNNEIARLRQEKTAALIASGVLVALAALF